jgi:hypothetical protein
MRALIFALALSMVPALAVADDDAGTTKTAKKKPPPDEDLPLEGPVQRQEGDYEGVQPGIPQKSERGRPLRKPKRGTLAWVGFSADGGTGHLFLQAPSEFQYTQSIEGRVLVVHLTGIKALAKNVRRPLDTRFFDSPVARISVTKVHARRAHKHQAARAAGVDVRIQFKKKAAAQQAAARTAIEGDGYFYLYLDVAEGAGAAPVEEPTPEPE